MGQVIKFFFLTILGVALTLGTYLYFYLGVYKPVQITTAEVGPLYLLYKNHMGAYNEIGPILRETESWALQHNVHCGRTFGEFIDDPQAVDQDRLRSQAGCVLDGKPPIPTGDFSFEEFPVRRYLVGKFQGSPSIGPFKVYPKMKAEMEKQRLRLNGPTLEIYTVNGANVETEYLFPIK